MDKAGPLGPRAGLHCPDVWRVPSLEALGLVPRLGGWGPPQTRRLDPGTQGQARIPRLVTQASRKGSPPIPGALRAPPHLAAGGGQGAKVARHLRVGWGHPWGFLGAAQHSGGGPGLDNLSGEKGVGSLHGRLN